MTKEYTIDGIAKTVASYWEKHGKATIPTVEPADYKLLKMRAVIYQPDFDDDYIFCSMVNHDIISEGITVLETKETFQIYVETINSIDSMHVFRLPDERCGDYEEMWENFLPHDTLLIDDLTIYIRIDPRIRYVPLMRP